MKLTIMERLIAMLMVATMIALAPIIFVLAVIKTTWTFFKGGLNAIKDE